MSHFDAYRDSFPNARLTRSKTGVLEVVLHTNDGTLAFNGYTHEQFVDLLHAIGSDRDNRVVILTGSGNALRRCPSVLKVSTSSPLEATTKSIARAGKSS